ncbi:MAG: glycosyltransferase [Saccharospirillum sp.]
MPKTPIKTLHVTFDMGIGGTEQVIRQLIAQSEHRFAENHIACIDGRIGLLGEALAGQGIPIYSHPRNPGLDFTLIRWLHRLIKQHRFQVVHCHQYSPYSYGWFAHWGTGARLVFTEHGRFHPDRHRKKARWLNPLMARTTQSLVAISKATRDALVEYEYLPRKRIDVIYNGIQGVTVNAQKQSALRQALGLREEDIIIGTVARLDAVKNQALMLRATRELRDAGFPVKLLLVGDGPERQALEVDTALLSLEDAVIFTGFQTEPGDYLSLMDVFLLPSFTEGTSMTLLEAMSLGIPTVATRVGGTPEIVQDQQTGLLISSDDLAAFTQAITALLTDKTLYQAMSAAAKHRFETTFTAQAMAQQYQQKYTP